MPSKRKCEQPGLMVVISSSLNDSSFGRPSHQDCANGVTVMTTRPTGAVKNAADTHTHMKRTLLQNLILPSCSAQWALKFAPCVPMILPLSSDCSEMVIG